MVLKQPAEMFKMKELFEKTITDYQDKLTSKDKKEIRKVVEELSRIIPGEF